MVVVGCTTNDDCRQTEACFNRDCVDPCNCGTNAQCFVNNHKPVCFCPEGYTGDPEVGCVKGRTLECRNGMRNESIVMEVPLNIQKTKIPLGKPS